MSRRWDGYWLLNTETNERERERERHRRFSTLILLLLFSLSQKQARRPPDFFVQRRRRRRFSRDDAQFFFFVIGRAGVFVEAISKKERLILGRKFCRARQLVGWTFFLCFSFYMCAGFLLSYAHSSCLFSLFLSQSPALRWWGRFLENVIERRLKARAMQLFQGCPFLLLVFLFRLTRFLFDLYEPKNRLMTFMRWRKY